MTRTAATAHPAPPGTDATAPTTADVHNRGTR